PMMNFWRRLTFWESIGLHESVGRRRWPRSRTARELFLVLRKSSGPETSTSLPPNSLFLPIARLTCPPDPPKRSCLPTVGILPGSRRICWRKPNTHPTREASWSPPPVALPSKCRIRFGGSVQRSHLTVPLTSRLSLPGPSCSRHLLPMRATSSIVSRRNTSARLSATPLCCSASTPRERFL